MNSPPFISKRTLRLAILFLLLMPLGQALAANIYVDEDCSLQNAIRSANEQAMVEPLAACEIGDAADGNPQVDSDGVEIAPGVDTIRIIYDGTAEGVITLDGRLNVTSHIVIEGNGTVIDGAGKQIFDVTGGSLKVADLTLTGGYSESNGGAIAVRLASVTLSNSVVSASSAKAMGGGIYAVDSDLSLFDSVVTFNTTGVLSKPETGEPAEQSSATDEAITWDTSGGGIYFSGDSNRLVIERSGLDSNRTLHNGGGLYFANGSASINNSTFSGNWAAGKGGAMYNAADGTLTHATIVFNSASEGGGVFDSSILQLYNTIIADNVGGDCSDNLTVLLGNLIRDRSCGHGGVSDDPLLLLLGGSPAYYLPQEGSPALDAASTEHCQPTDQRGVERSPEACDIGAAEYEPGLFTFQIQSAQASLSLPAAGTAAAEQTPTPSPEAELEPAEPPTALPSTCAALPSNIVFSGYQNGTACKVLDASGVGNQTIIDYGFIHAVDVFGELPSPVKACFQHGRGIIILLDAANSPRNIVPLQPRIEGSLLCAEMDRPGTVVLLPLSFAQSGLAQEPVWQLNGCTVTTTAILNLRSGPSSNSAILGNVLNDVRLTTDLTEQNWYRVDYYNIIGWLSADYLTKSGNCG